MSRLKAYKTIILDCDGVVFDSNDFKIEAFRRVINKRSPEVADQFAVFVSENFGKSRFYFFDEYFATFLNAEKDTELYIELLKEYAELCECMYLNCSFTPGFEGFLNKYSDKNFFIASGSEQEQLKRVFRARGIERAFTQILGSPTSKQTIVSKIAQTYDNCIMIGDAESDVIAAQNAGIDFIFMKSFSTSTRMLHEYSGQQIDDLGEL